MEWIRKVICKIKGHEYPCLVFDACSLCFCERCGKEVAGRNFSDLEPLPKGLGSDYFEDGYFDDDWS